MTIRPLCIGLICSPELRGRYITAAARLSALEVGAILEPSPALRPARRGLQTEYHRLDSFLSHPALRAVVVDLGPADRADYAQRCLEAGMHVIVRAPISRDAARTEALLRKPQSATAILPLFSFAPGCLQAAAPAISARIGEIRHVCCHWTVPLSPARLEGMPRWAEPFEDQAAAGADYCCGLLGAVECLSADVEVRGAAGGHLGSLIMSHRQGTSVHHISGTLRRRAHARCTLEGPSGRAEVRSAPQPRVIVHQDGKQAVDLTDVVFVDLPSITAESRALADLLEAIASADGAGPLRERAALEAVAAAYISSRERSKVSLPLGYPPNLQALLSALLAR